MDDEDDVKNRKTDPGAVHYICKTKIDTEDCGLIIRPKTQPDQNCVLHITFDNLFYGERQPEQPVVEDVKRRRKRKNALQCCGKTLRDSYRYMTHLKHEVERVWAHNLDASNNQPHVERIISRCRHCYKEYECPQKLQVHMEVVHMLESTDAVCRICEKEFNLTKDLLQHMVALHRFPELPYWCKICEYRTSSHKDLIKHIKHNHSESTKFMCYFCLYCTNSPAGFRKHMELHKKQKNKVPCPYCRLVFVNKYQMEGHICDNHQVPSDLWRLLKINKESLDKFWIIATKKANIGLLCTRPTNFVVDPNWSLNMKIEEPETNNHIQDNDNEEPPGTRVVHGAIEGFTLRTEQGHDTTWEIIFNGSMWYLREQSLFGHNCGECDAPMRPGVQHYSSGLLTCSHCPEDSPFRTRCPATFDRHVNHICRHRPQHPHVSSAATAAAT